MSTVNLVEKDHLDERPPLFNLSSPNVVVEQCLGSAPVSQLSDTFVPPQRRFWETNGVGEGISCRNSSFLKSKQGVWSRDKVHSCDKFSPILVVFERFGCIFQLFFFFLKSVRQLSQKCLGLGSTVTQNSWGRKATTTFFFWMIENEPPAKGLKEGLHCTGAFVYCKSHHAPKTVLQQGAQKWNWLKMMFPCVFVLLLLLIYDYSLESVESFRTLFCPMSQYALYRYWYTVLQLFKYFFRLCIV